MSHSKRHNLIVQAQSLHSILLYVLSLHCHWYSNTCQRWSLYNAATSLKLPASLAPNSTKHDTKTFYSLPLLSGHLSIKRSRTDPQVAVWDRFTVAQCVCPTVLPSRHIYDNQQLSGTPMWLLEGLSYTHTYLSFEVRWVLSHSSDRSMQNICKRQCSTIILNSLATNPPITDQHTCQDNNWQN